jgi:hypothetical protein
MFHSCSFVGAGRGYRPNKKDKQNPALDENMDCFEVGFYQDRVGRPYTGFPSEKK